MYDFPAAYDGIGQTVAVFVFNGDIGSGQSAPGGYRLTTLNDYFTNELGMNPPALTDVVVQGPGGIPEPAALHQLLRRAPRHHQRQQRRVCGRTRVGRMHGMGLARRLGATAGDPGAGVGFVAARGTAQRPPQFTSGCAEPAVLATTRGALSLRTHTGTRHQAHAVAKAIAHAHGDAPERPVPHASTDGRRAFYGRSERRISRAANPSSCHRR